MNVSIIWSLQITMFLIVISGFILTKTGKLSHHTRSVLTELVINFVMPLNIIGSFQMAFNLELLKKFITLIAIGVAAQFLCLLLTMFAYNRYNDRKRKIFNYATIVSNSGFLGNPIAEGTFGSVGLMYASVFTIPTRVAMWSAGLAQFTDETDKMTAAKKVLIHPCMIGVYIGVTLMVTGVHLTGALEKTVFGVGRCTTALTMILIGCMAAEVKDIRSVITRDIIYFTIIRLVIIPSIVFFGCKLAGVDKMIMGVSVLLAGMPAGSTTAILAAKYDGDYVFATKLVVFSTLITLVSVPIWSIILLNQ